MTTPSFCANCGSALGGGLRFCPNCGQAVETSDAVPAAPAPQAYVAPQVEYAPPPQPYAAPRTEYALPSQPVAKNNTPVMLGGIAVLVAVVAVFFLMSGGDSDKSSNSSSSISSDSSSAPQAPSDVSSYKLTIMVPAAWAHEDLKSPAKGRVTAAVAADITRERPQGPKATAQILDPAAASVDTASFLKNSKADNVTVVQQPKNVKVGQDEMEGVQIVLNETYGSTTLTTVYIIARHTKLNTYVLFTGEVPSTQFAAQERTLISVAEGAKLSKP